MGGLDNGNVVSHNFGGRKKWGGRQAGLVSPEVALIGLCVAFSFVFTWSPLCAWLVLFRRSVVSDSLWPLGLQHTRLPCLSLSCGVCSNSCALSRWCHPTSSSSAALFSFAFNLSQHQVFPNESALHIRWPKYWSFSFSIRPSSEYSGLISFRIDWFDLLAVQGILKSFSSTTIQKPQLFGVQPSSWSNYHISTSLLEKLSL